MRLALAGPSRTYAPNVFVYIPQQPASFVSSLAGAAGMRSAGIALPNRSAQNFGRGIQLNPTTSCSFHSVAVMRPAFFPRSRLILRRKNHEGYVSETLNASLPSVSITSHLAPSDPPQRSEEWFAVRRDKLTTSSFSTALGFWKGNRRPELWYHKVFAPESMLIQGAAVAAMNWGVVNELAAIERYKSMTGNDVSFLGFAVHKEAESEWLGASPDGLVGCYPNAGILEVKCPYNKGKPELGLPWQSVPFYYMPQVQGQMEIMNREWVDLYCWTLNGSVLFRVFRDREYWGLMHGMLHDFWWGNVVPAKQAMMMENEEAVMGFEPDSRHELTRRIVGKSIGLAAKAVMLCRDIGGHVEFFR